MTLDAGGEDGCDSRSAGPIGFRRSSEPLKRPGGWPQSDGQNRPRCRAACRDEKRDDHGPGADDNCGTDLGTKL